MTTEYKGVPAGASAIIPRLVCRDVEAEIDFCCQTFGAVEGVRRPGPDGKVAHAMLRFGPAMLMLEAEWPTESMAERSALTPGPSRTSRPVWRSSTTRWCWSWRGPGSVPGQRERGTQEDPLARNASPRGNRPIDLEHRDARIRPRCLR